MELADTKKVLAYIAAAFPKYFQKVTKQSADKQSIVWNEALAEYSLQAVMVGVKSFIASDASGFPPTPGQIIEYIHFTANPRDHSGTEAWALVRKAVNVPWDQFEASFATLPRAAQIAVGSPESLKELAQMDMQRFETVAQSNFLRMYDAAQRREAKEQVIPNAAIAAREILHKELEARRPTQRIIETSAPAKIETKAIEAESSKAPDDKLAALRRRLGG